MGCTGGKQQHHSRGIIVRREVNVSYGDKKYQRTTLQQQHYPPNPYHNQAAPVWVVEKSHSKGKKKKKKKRMKVHKRDLVRGISWDSIFSYDSGDPQQMSLQQDSHVQIESTTVIVNNYAESEEEEAEEECGDDGGDGGGDGGGDD